MQPQALNRAIQEEIRRVLGDPSLRGKALMAALAALASRGVGEPFRAGLRQICGLNRPEESARDTLDSIESHRARLQDILGRDPGPGVAAADYLHAIEADGNDLPLRGGGRGSLSPPVAPEAPSLDALLDVETARSDRSGRPLALVILAPDRPAPAPDLDAVAAALRDAAREIDHVARILPEGFAVILPCTPGAQALMAAARMVALLEAVAGTRWSAGVAARPETTSDAAGLARHAHEALRAARLRPGAGAVLHRSERRSHRRRPAAALLRARLSDGGRETDAVVEDLSIGGALLGTREPLAPGNRVLLALSGTTARPRRVAIASRVLRTHEVPNHDGAPTWRAGVMFVPGHEVRGSVASLLADLPRAPGSAERDP